MVLARETFRISESTVGFFLAVQTIGAAVCNIIWGQLSIRRGNHRVVLVAVLGVALIPCLALGLSAYAHVLQRMSEWVIAGCFAPIFFLIGGSTTGVFIGFKSYLLEHRTRRETPDLRGHHQYRDGHRRALSHPGRRARGYGASARRVCPVCPHGLCRAGAVFLLAGDGSLKSQFFEE